MAELSPHNEKVVGSIPAPTVIYPSVPESDTEPQVDPTVIQWCLDVYEWLDLTDGA